jgi:hypothetical protein
MEQQTVNHRKENCLDLDKYILTIWPIKLMYYLIIQGDSVARGSKLLSINAFKCAWM